MTENTAFLIGREVEIEGLSFAHQNILQKPHIIVFSGPSGIGKSTLLSHFVSTIRQDATISVMMPCEKGARSLAPILAIFEEIISQILLLSPTQIQKWQNILKESTSNYAALLNEYIPNFSNLVKPNKAQETFLDTLRSSRSLFFLLSELLKTLSENITLVLALDNIQWGDEQTLLFIRYLIENKRIENNLMLILSIQEPFPTDTPVVDLITWLKNETGLTWYTLSPLSVENIQTLISNRFPQISDSQKQEIQDILQENSNGNPLLISFFLRSLENPEDITLLTQTSVSDFISRTLDTLPQKFKFMIFYFSQLGFFFDPNWLTKSGLATDTDIQTGTLILQKKGLLIKEANGHYHFLHEEIVSIAQTLFSKEETLRVRHALLNTFLSSKLTTETAPLIVSFFKDIPVEILNSEQRFSVVLALSFSAKKALQVNAYTAARNYLTQALSLLPVSSGMGKEGLRFDIQFELAVTHFLSGEYTYLDEHYEALLTLAPHTNSAIQVLILATRQHLFLYEYEAAFKQMQKALALLKEPVPSSKLALYFSLIKNSILYNQLSKKLFRKTTPPTFEIALLEKTELMSVWFHAAESVNGRNPLLFGYFLLKMAIFSIQIGYSKYSALGFVAGGFLYLRQAKLNLALKSADLALSISQKHFDPVLHARVLSICNGIFDPIKFSWPEIQSRLSQSYQYCKDIGEFRHASASVYMGLISSWVRGAPLPQILRWLGKFESHFRMLAYSDHDLFFEYSQMLQTACTAKTLPDNFADPKPYHRFSEDANTYNCISIFLLAFAVLGENFSLACRIGFELKPHADNLSVGLFFTEYHFFHSIALFAQMPHMTLKERFIALRTLQKNRRLINRLAKECPSIFESKKYLLDALAAGYTSDATAPPLFCKAISQAQLHELPQVEALAHEYLADFYVRNNQWSSAELHYREAKVKYAEWGFVTKLSAISRKMKQRPKEISHGLQPYEFSSESSATFVLEIVRTLSNRPDKKTLIEALFRLGCLDIKATRAICFLGKNDFEKSILWEHQKIISSAEFLPSHAKNVLNHCLVMGKSIVQNNPSTSLLFQNDPYFNSTQPSVITCIPILWNNNIEGILYFEDTNLGSVQILRLEILGSLIAATNEGALDAVTPEEKAHAEMPLPTNNTSIQTANQDLSLDRDFLSFLSKGIGHEIRNPFFIIRLRAEEIIANSQYSTDVITFADSVIRNVDRVLEITDILLKYANQEATSEGKVILSELFFDVQVTATKISPNGTQISWDINIPPTLAVRGNKNRLYQAFNKIVMNAMEAMDKPTSKISIHAKGWNTHQIEIKIMDNGPGIVSQDLSKVFNLFFTTKYGHHGAGLTIAKEVITALGGSIDIASVPDQGTTVTIRLPKY